MSEKQLPKFRIYNHKAANERNGKSYKDIKAECVFSNAYGQGIAIEVEKDVGVWSTVAITVHPEQGLCVRIWDEDYLGEYWPEQEKLMKKLAK